VTALSKQVWGFRSPRPSPWRCPAKLLAILAHKGSSWPQPDTDFAIGADKGAFGGDAPDNIFRGERTPRGRILGYGVKAVPVPRSLSKTR
jgi:hypothetical protein